MALIKRIQKKRTYYDLESKSKWQGRKAQMKGVPEQALGKKKIGSKVKGEHGITYTVKKKYKKKVKGYQIGRFKLI